MGRASTIVVLLLAGILAALVVLVFVLVTQKDGVRPRPDAPGPSRAETVPVVAEGRTIRRAELPSPPPSPEPIGDPDRIKETLRAGETYRVVLKAGLDARVEDKAWGLKEVVTLAYAAEMAIDRHIESNDGKRIVELRHFVTSRNVKLLCKVEEVHVELGTPGTLLLGVLDGILPGTTEVVAIATPIVEALLGHGARAAARSHATKAVAHVDALAGKTVRITYVDEVGVEAIEPVGCNLTAEERDFVFNTAILSDCYLLPDVEIGPGKSWAVDGAQLAGFLDPSLRGTPAGEVVMAREADTQEGGKPYATLRIQGGSVTVNASDASTRRIGSFTPRGTLRYSLADKIVEHATLAGRFQIEEVSTDHLLFETSFRSRPTLTIDYACSIR